MNGIDTWYMDGDEWSLLQTEDQPERTVYFETILSQSNGLLGVRGYDEECNGGRDSIREGYLGGVFAELDEQASQIINAEMPWASVQMVSLPELFGCRLVLHGERFTLDAGDVLEFRRELNLQDALLSRFITWRSPAGRTSRLCFRRFLSAHTPCLGFQQIEVEAIDWSGEASMDFSFETDVLTMFRCGDKRQPELPQYHYSLQSSGSDGALAWVDLQTKGTTHHVAIVSSVSGASVDCDVHEGRVEQVARATVEPCVSRTIERAFAVVSDREAAEPRGEARDIVRRAEASGFTRELATHRAVWSKRWDVADVKIEGAPRDQKAVRFSLFQMLQMMPQPGASLSIPARGLSFNRYRGLYFWDTEIFMMPFYTYVFPDRAADLLRFRHRTLRGAQDTARAKLDRKGALFAWMSDSETGRDDSIDGRVTYLQHQNGDIVYAIDQYVRASGDVTFMVQHGFPVLVETARFWASHLVEEDGVWHSENAVGPDEDRGGGRDNGYTNLIARFNLVLAAQWAVQIGEHDANALVALTAALSLEAGEPERWKAIAVNLVVPEIPELGVPLQDEYILSKRPAEMDAWNLRDACEHWTLPSGTVLDDYQVIKQADIVLATLLLDQTFSPEDMAAAFDFYEPMTQHISSLSDNTHAIVAARLGKDEQAYTYFQRAMALDLDDIKQVTRDGLHAAAFGGCWQAAVFGFAGMDLRSEVLTFKPQLPDTWTSLSFTIVLKGVRHRIVLDQEHGLLEKP